MVFYVNRNSGNPCNGKEGGAKRPELTADCCGTRLLVQTVVTSQACPALGSANLWQLERNGSARFFIEIICSILSLTNHEIADDAPAVSSEPIYPVTPELIYPLNGDCESRLL